MRPRERRETGQKDLFKARLDQIVDMHHALAKLGGAIDWGFLEIDPLFDDVSIERWQRLTGAPARHAHSGQPFGRSGSTAMTDKLASPTAGAR